MLIQKVLSHTRVRAVANYLWLGLALVCGLGIAVLPFAQMLVVLAGLMGLAVLAAIVAEPTLGIALTLIAGPLGPLEREVLQLLPIDSAQLVLLFTLFAYALRQLYQRPTRSSIYPPTSSTFYPFTALIPFALLLFLAVALVSFFQIRDFGNWAAEGLKWVELLLLCVLVGWERNRRRLALIIGAVLLSASFQGALGLWQYFRGYGPVVFLVPGTSYYRSYGTFQQPNPFGGYVGLIWPFCLGVALWCVSNVKRQTSNVRFSILNFQLSIAIFLACLSLSATVLALSGVFTSGSRGARLAAGGALVAMGLATLRKPVLRLVIGLVGFAALAAIAFNQIPAALTNPISSLIADYGDLDVRGIYLTAQNFSNLERLAHWQVAFDMMRDHPWLGVGFGNYDAYYEQYRLLYWVNGLGHAHNYYLNIFAETGVLGFLAYLFMWVGIFGVTLARIREASNVKRQTSNVKRRILNSQFLYIGLLGTWTHLTIHHLFDNLYVANTFLLLGVLLGLLINQSWLYRVKRELA